MERKKFLQYTSLLGMGGILYNMGILKQIQSGFKNTDRMPVIFVGHGNPMNAIEDNEFSLSWKSLGKSLSKPSAILCISAHWETKGSWITAMEKPITIYDFNGFPDELFEIQYPAPGNPKLVLS